MQTTTTEFTTQDLHLLEMLHEREQGIAKTRLRFGLILLLAAALITIVNWDDIDLRSVGMLLFIPGALITISAIRKEKKSKKYESAEYSKQELSGVLVHTALVNHWIIRYTFRETQLDLHVLTTNAINGSGLSHKNLIDTAETLTGTSVTLSYVEFRPGVSILMNIRYDEYDHVETVVPINTADEQQVGHKAHKSILITLGTAIIITLLWSASSGFNNESLSVFTFFLFVIMLIMLYSASKKKLAPNKLVIRTTITEVLRLMSEDGELTHYRLADGTLLPVLNREYKPGDNVEIQFMNNNNGGREIFIKEIMA